MTRPGQPPAPALLRAGDVLGHTFTLDGSGEAWVALTLSAPGTSWLRAEPAVVELSVDGQDGQQIILAAGADPTRYQRFLGALVPGTHHLRLGLHNGLSASGAQEVAVADIHTECVKERDPAALVWRHVPVLHYRALSSPCDSLTTDTPLVLFYRSHRTGRTTSVEYHVIFSHEDAGTDLTGLLARWGHTVDIEWVFRVTVDDEARVIAEQYQGPAHATLGYLGPRTMGGHPVLQVATSNGTVTDRPACPYRAALAPVCAQPEGEPREGVLQQFPWIYRVSALEVLRQVPLEWRPSPASPLPADLRSYLFLQWKRLRGPVAPLEARVRVGHTWHGSAWGRAALAFQEADAESTAVKLPAGTTEADVTGLAIRVLEPPPQPLEVALVRAFFLDAAYRPRPSFIPPGVWRLGDGQREHLVWERRWDEVS